MESPSVDSNPHVSDGCIGTLAKPTYGLLVRKVESTIQVQIPVSLLHSLSHKLSEKK